VAEPSSEERRAWLVMLGSLARWLEEGVQTSAGRSVTDSGAPISAQDFEEGGGWGSPTRAKGTAQLIHWELGTAGCPCVVVHGRERVAA
jgi:hypothetical protein